MAEQALRFGIPQLDEILGAAGLAAEHENAQDVTTSTATILGPDGTGKSVFSLHIASTYLSDAIRRAIRGKPVREALCALSRQSLPDVLYVSTDLNFDRANVAWKNFWLDFPWSRYIPFECESEIDWRKEILRSHQDPIWLELKRLSPDGTAGGGGLLRDFFYPSPESCDRRFPVGYLDLASKTAGDDWNLLMKIVSASPRKVGCEPNLLIVDSVAGFETLIGDVDAFGQRTSRRARIAQLIRATEGSWNVVFIVEEPKPGEHNPEEFVTDMVLRLRRDGSGQHARRLLEIEKARARSYGIGEHPFEIRDGSGTSTGDWANPDDPRASIHPLSMKAIDMNPEWKKAREGRCEYCAYIQVFQSLHFRSRDFSKRVGNMPGDDSSDLPRKARGFGIPFLDNLLNDRGDPSQNGLDAGKITALVGSEGTRRTLLAHTFLQVSHANFGKIFLSLANDCARMIALADTTEPWGDLQATREYQAPSGETVEEVLTNWWKEAHGMPMHVRDQSGTATPTDSGKWLREVLGGKWLLAPTPEKPDGEDKAFSIRESPARYVVRNDRDAQAKGFVGVGLTIVCSLLRQVPGLLAPTILITTEDYRAERLADDVLKIHWEDIAAGLVILDITSDSDQKLAREHLARVLQRVLLVRRVELHDATTPQLFHIVERTVLAAINALPAGKIEKGGKGDSSTYVRDSEGLVRAVIGDLTLFRNTFSDIVDDRLFLPALVFRLRRWGVTALLVDAADGRPDRTPTNEFDAELRSLTDHQIYTWHVNFFGENRVAIAPIPTLSPRSSGIIRELAVIEKDGAFLQPAQPKVNPHFELYSGLESGEPKPISLQVLFYEETRAFREYTESENALFSRVFSAIQGFGQPVIEVRATRDYEGLRDYCQLPTDTRLPYSLVFVVDGYWSLGRQGALRNQTDYLRGRIALEPGDPGEGEFEKYVDVFRLYRETKLSEKYTECHRKEQRRIRRGKKGVDDAGQNEPDEEDFRGKERWLYFRQIGNSLSELESWLEDETSAEIKYLYLPRTPRRNHHDRVPFTWDFGFLLCNQKQWEDAGTIELKTFGQETKVSDVWNALPRIQTEPIERSEASDYAERIALASGFTVHKQPDGTKPDHASWRCFFEACKLVAEMEERRSGKPTVAFDISMMAPDSLSCLLFEIWASEIGRTAAGRNQENTPDRMRRAGDELRKVSNRSFTRETRVDFLDWLTSREETQSVTKMFEGICARTREPGDMPGFSVELYKTWLLLLEVLPIADCTDPKTPFQLRSDREPDIDAVAVRHWYKTACVASKKREELPVNDQSVYVPVRLPGTFSTRGDWFLAVAQGSRSQRLADLALDMLTSRRANRSRLYLGLGLPTRDLIEGPAAEAVRTRLTISTPDSIGNVLYGDLTKLGGRYATQDGKDPSQGDFWWFYRSSFKDYDRQAATFRRWIGRVLTWTFQHRQAHRSDWEGGFRGYDDMTSGSFNVVREYDSFREFAPFIDLLIADLKQCRIDKDEGNEVD